MPTGAVYQRMLRQLHPAGDDINKMIAEISPCPQVLCISGCWDSCIRPEMISTRWLLKCHHAHRCCVSADVETAASGRRWYQQDDCRNVTMPTGAVYQRMLRQLHPAGDDINKMITEMSPCPQVLCISGCWDSCIRPEMISTRWLPKCHHAHRCCVSADVETAASGQGWYQQGDHRNVTMPTGAVYRWILRQLGCLPLRHIVEVGTDNDVEKLRTDHYVEKLRLDHEMSRALGCS